MRLSIIYMLTSVALTMVSIVAIAVIYVTSTNPRDVKVALLEHVKSVAKPSIVVDIHGNSLGQFVDEARYPIKLSQVPPLVRKAFLAAEDHEFYDHSGVSFKGLTRSLLVNLHRDKLSQGGSTITQQLVRSHL